MNRKKGSDKVKRKSQIFCGDESNSYLWHKTFTDFEEMFLAHLHMDVWTLSFKKTTTNRKHPWPKQA